MVETFDFEIPTKYDIIPIHNSDRGSFKRCRQYWDWSSPTRTNLTLRADVLGINIPMFYGTGIHYALEQFYTPGLRRSPVEAFQTWHDIQWNGGVVTEEWLDRVYDLQPQRMDGPDSYGAYHGAERYRVRGLEDILPDPDHFVFDDLLVLGVEMMKFYEKYAAREDDFEPLMAEHTFSIPVWDYENNCILKAVDKRQESPNCGKTLEVHARGRQDLIKVRPNGKLGIVDHKTAAKIEEDLAVMLETDEQCTTYLYAAQLEADYYDLPHKGEPFEEVLFNVLRKAYPKPPTVLQNGYSFSVNRTEESTTHEMLMEYVNSLPKELWPSGFSVKEQAYVDYLRDVGDSQFIVRKPVRRNKYQLANAGYRLWQESLDMLAADVQIYPNLTNDWKCKHCAFRAPCLAKMDGSDFEQLIADNYAVNRDR